VTALRQRQFLGRCHMSQKAVALDLFFGTRGAGVRVLLVGASLTAETSCACLSAAGYDVQRSRLGRLRLPRSTRHRSTYHRRLGVARQGRRRAVPDEPCR
jgi:hypothetical protein